MRKRLGCLHAHYSNIEYIEKAFSIYDIDLIHFVDPALMRRISFDENFREEEAQAKVKEQVEWIAKSNVDAILITCTNYIAFLQEEQFSVPVIKIDEPYFEAICQLEEPLIILFTNQATVDHTIGRLNDYAQSKKKSLDFEVIVLNHLFELIMQGKKEKYDNEISKFIKLKGKKKVISVAQLSMVDAAELAKDIEDIKIIHPLSTLVSSIVSQLKLKRKISINS